MNNQIDFQLDRRITLKTVKEWIKLIAAEENVRVVWLKPDEGDGGYNYGTFGDGIWLAPFRKAKAGDVIGKYTIERDCDNPVECLLISFFHELAHAKLRNKIPHVLKKYAWNGTSDFQYELWLTMLGVDYAFTKYGIRFSDQALLWLIGENNTYNCGPCYLCVQKPNSNSYEVTGIPVDFFGKVPVHGKRK